jgi:hypothetical protein
VAAKAAVATQLRATLLAGIPAVIEPSGSLEEDTMLANSPTPKSPGEPTPFRSVAAPEALGIAPVAANYRPWTGRNGAAGNYADKDVKIRSGHSEAERQAAQPGIVAERQRRFGAYVFILHRHLS